jgi:plastocyanin
MGKARLMTRRSLLGLTAGITIVVLAACATGPQPPAYRLAPDGAKEFVLRMDQGNFWPSSISVNQGDRVRFVIHSYYQFAQFSFPQFNLNRQIPHDAPETVEFVATERGWFDFYGYVSSPYAARLTLARSFGSGDAGTDQTIYGRLYVQ